MTPTLRPARFEDEDDDEVENEAPLLMRKPPGVEEF
jgi:hypothetical protein